MKKNQLMGRDTKGEFPWRSVEQISGCMANLQGAINLCQDGSTVEVDLKLACNLIEICRQARHTEVGHRPDLA